MYGLSRDPERHGRVSDRELCGEFDEARSYSNFQTHPVWALGWSTPCKKLKFVLTISKACYLVGGQLVSLYMKF
jgi:hypothetical protein